MKKILAVLLILVLALGCIGCGNNEETPSGDESTNVDQNVAEGEGTPEGETDGEAAGEAEGEADQDSGNTINPEDYYISDSYDEMEAAYDFDMQIDASFGMDAVVEKVDYSKLADLAGEMEARVSAAGEEALNTSFSVFGDYEEEDESEIDKLTYAIGMENNDSEGIYLEGGAYHNKDGKHYQYVTYISQNMYEANDANTKIILENIQDAMGVTLKEKELSKAIQQAFQKGKDTLDYFSLIDVETASGSGYKETIKVTVDAFATEDNVIGYYVSCERERCYE